MPKPKAKALGTVAILANRRWPFEYCSHIQSSLSSIDPVVSKMFVNIDRLGEQTDGWTTVIYILLARP